MPDIEYTLVGNDDVEDIVQYLSGESLLALDTETYRTTKPYPRAYDLKTENRLWISDPFINNIRLVQIRSRDSESFIFDLHELSDHAKSRLCWLLQNPEIVWLGHNLKFDWRMIAVNLNVELEKVWDTMLATIAIGYAVGDGAMWARGVGLKDACRDFLGVKLDKTEQNSNWGAKELTPNQYQYAANDLLYLFDLHDVLRRAIDEEYDMLGGVQLEMELLPAVAGMEIAGIDFDLDLYYRVQKAAKAYIPKLEEALCKFIDWPMIAVPPLERIKTGRTWKPNPKSFDGEAKSPLDSNPFMLKALRAKGVEVENLQGKHLEELSDKYPILKTYGDYKDLTKQLGIAYDAWVHPLTGRIHPEFNQSGAATGRFSCNNPNLQQVPKTEVTDPETGDKLCYRYCFIAPDGHELASADYSGQELRVMAVLSGDPNLIHIHKNEPDYVEDPTGKLDETGKPVMVKNMGADVHAMSCELVYGAAGITRWNAKTTPYPGLSGKTYRDVIKTVVYGLAYGKTAPGLSKDMGITVEEAETIIDSFFKPYRVLHQWLEKVGKTADDTRLSRYGIPEAGITRWRMVNSDRHEDKGALNRAGKNTPIQGCSALMMKKALCSLRKTVQQAGGVVCATIHDEVLVRYPVELREAVLAAVDKGMTEGSNVFLRNVVNDKYGVGCAKHWSKD